MANATGVGLQQARSPPRPPSTVRAAAMRVDIHMPALPVRRGPDAGRRKVAVRACNKGMNLYNAAPRLSDLPRFSNRGELEREEIGAMISGLPGSRAAL